jgi:hypothetical protein
MRAAILRIRNEIRRPVGINGWCSSLFTLACVVIIRIEGRISIGPWEEVYFTARYFAEYLLSIGFLYCGGCPAGKVVGQHRAGDGAAGGADRAVAGGSSGV